MKKILAALLMTSLLFSCWHEKSTNTTTVIVNNSDHKIKISPFDDGVSYTVDSKIILNNSTTNVLSASNRGKSTGPSYATNIMFYDSLYVIYDDTVKSIHYRQNLPANNPKAIKYDSSRSLFNEKNYNYKIISEEKYKISTEYTFTFTEQDYLDAKGN